MNEALQEQMRSFAQLLQSETLQLSTQIEGLHRVLSWGGGSGGITCSSSEGRSTEEKVKLQCESS